MNKKKKKKALKPCADCARCISIKSSYNNVHSFKWCYSYGKGDIILSSALGIPRTRQYLALSLPRFPAEWLAQIYFFYPGHTVMFRMLILDKVGKAMSLLFLQQPEG